MLHSELNIDHRHRNADDDLLSPSRELWPAAAAAAYRRVLSELNGWCRDHDWPTSANPWMAENAVREGWS